MSDLPIQIPNCELSRIGAQFRSDLSIQDWQEIGHRLHAVESCYQFLIGDWLAYGERSYGEKYAIACESIGIEYGTARNWKSVCCNVELSRRNDKLTFSHHQAVAHLSPPQQSEWLASAEYSKWSVADLREHIRDDGAEHAGEDHGKPIKGFTGYIASAVRIINERADSIGTWSHDERERTAELLRPIVEFYEKLKAVESV